MKICYLAFPYCTANIAHFVHVQEVCENLSSLHNDVFLIIRTIDDDHTKIPLSGNVQTHVVNLKKVSEVGLPRFLFTCAALFFKLLYLIKKEKIDIVYIRSSMFDFIGVLAGVLLGRPAILEVNAPYWASFSIKWSDAIVTSSKVILHESVYGEKVGDDKFCDKVLETMWGANINAFNPKVDGSRIRKKYEFADCPVVVYAGGFSPWNGLENLLKASIEVLKEVPKAKFLLVGGIGSDFRRICSLAQDYDLMRAFTFAGEVEYGEVPLYVATADVCVAPYSLKGRMMRKYGLFGAPLKIFEYMAAGKPIVATDIGNIKNIIKNGKSGLLVKPDDPKGLADAIILLIRDKDLATYLATHARNEVGERFSWAKHAQLLDELFRKVHRSKIHERLSFGKLVAIFLCLSSSVFHGTVFVLHSWMSSQVREVRVQT